MTTKKKQVKQEEANALSILLASDKELRDGLKGRDQINCIVALESIGDALEDLTPKQRRRVLGAACELWKS